MTHGNEFINGRPPSLIEDLPPLLFVFLVSEDAGASRGATAAARKFDGAVDRDAVYIFRSRAAGRRDPHHLRRGRVEA